MITAGIDGVLHSGSGGEGAAGAGGGAWRFRFVVYDLYVL